MTVKFDKRVTGINISGIRKMFEGAGPGAINLGLGQPDFDTPEHIKAEAIKAIEEGFTGYTGNMGIPELREALVAKFKNENGLSYSPAQILVTSGASEALHIAIEALCGKGDEILVPDPGFLSYSALATMADATPVPVPLGETLRYDPEMVKKYITKNTRAIVLNSPSNPTGAVQTPAEIKAIVEIALDKGVTVISDEVYEHFIYGGVHESPARYGDNVITINAASKTYAMTGWRLGYLAAGPDYVDQMLKVHQYVQACACSISQRAAWAALTGPQNCVTIMRDEFRRRRDYLIGELHAMGVECVMPQGAFYAFPYVGDEQAKVMELLKKGVITTPGSSFGEHGKGFIRMCYATSMPNLQKAVGIMKTVL
ncbi:putative aspartate aminotransferase [Methanocella paludicola SANAE]|uniref:Aspartate aminotransferase n=1 Tax=Methanocella paludicola (strain DSM 17711 / JCM 13418 / NBRC 101707 / SANAE) TaxID=304371 RepID=D1YXL3_METPS|nr:pyridoxal phosphate-dependent aminotransferase [Methanocella paludicola]BAI61185.1 putative aspartate aminotransferase [Methanocella paludicola SANAE]